ncbi:MAG: amidohydrolase family protein [Candidatus Binatia bacterium]|nr:amidohydrolase family protein [Candidatus Binatia bacterium]
MKALPRLKFDGAVDADGHVLEPPDIWEKYIDPGHRDVAMKIQKDDAGLEYLDIGGGVSSKIIRKGYPAGLGMMDRLGGIIYERESTGSPYVDMAPLGSMDPKERVERLDMENIAKSILYPTLGVLWVAEQEDESIIQPNLTAYNRWIVDFCSDSGGRLVPVAQLSLGDPEAAEKELRRAAADGVKGIWVPPFTTTRKPLGDSAHDRVFAACQELGLPLGIHPVFEPKWCAPGRFGDYTSAAFGFFHNVTAGDAVRHAFTSMFQYGVFGKFPDLKVIVLETGGGWIGYWLDRMDTVYGTYQGKPVRDLLPELPSHYFRKQCWIAGDPDEKSLAAVIPTVGEDRFFWASDFPHPDHPPEYVPEVERLVDSLPASARPGFLGENVIEAYRLNE